MQSHANSRLDAPLANRVASDATAAQIADAMGATWQDIDAALASIIGSRGVAALYKRSLYVAASAHPWLASAHGQTESAIDLAALKSTVSQQSSAAAALGCKTLFQTFHQLLGSLVGDSLTERLLRSVWTDSSSGPPPQDTSQ